MRLKYIIYPLAIIALMVMLNGCEKFTEGINTSTCVCAGCFIAAAFFRSAAWLYANL